METQKDPWVEDKEPPVEAVRGTDLSEREQDRRAYVEQRTQITLAGAERWLLETEYDYCRAIDDVTSATIDYIEAEAQQARTRVRVIEKLMAESEAAAGRKQSEAKRGEVLSVSAAEKIVSGHPEYTQVRDDVAGKLTLKSEAEYRCKKLEQLMLNMREIVQTRRKFGDITMRGRHQTEATTPAVVSSSTTRDAQRNATFDAQERDTILQRDSRGLEGVERVTPRRERLVERPYAGTAAGEIDELHEKG